MTGRYPLEGITVIDLGQIYNGPYATFLMATAGARVIKIEPHGGEHLRRRGVVGGAALPFAMLNANKTSVTLNLKTEHGKALLIDMVKKGDVLLENFAPGAMDRLGLGWEKLHAINPRLVYGSGTGFGLSGPKRDYPAMDLTVQAMAGVMSITGFADRPPVKAGPAICDFITGVHLYGAVVTALYEREKTGVGRLVEVSMQEAIYSSLSSNLGMWWGSNGKAPPRTGNQHGGLAEAPYNVYPTKDGYIAIICVGEQHWKSLIEAMERPDLRGDSRFTSLKKRVENMAAVDELVNAFTARFDKQPLFELLMKHRVPCAPVRDLDEVVNDPHLHARGALLWQEHPELGRIPVQSSPLRFAGTDQMPITPSRKLGADNDAIYGEWLGLSATDIAALTKEGVI
ncbi:MAG: CoA transferase [Betaproteobacteria bacterium]|nr:CoA transferase [Betaproteobacteria bacterium]